MDERRLIDANAFIAKYCELCGGGCNLDDCCCTTVDDLMNAPTIDAVPVVRCHKCKRSRPLNQNDPFEMRFSEECVWCVEHCNAMLGDDFCSYGERKDTDATD